MAKILVTGAGGYIGSVASYLLLQKKHEVIGVDNFSKGYRQPLDLLKNKFGDKQFRYYEIDLRENPSEIFKQEPDIEAVVHYAAYCDVGESSLHPELYFSNNTYGTAQLLDAMVENKVGKIVFSSTCAVYGESQYVPLDEKHPINPVSPYGESKNMSEKIIQWYHRLKGLDYLILRYFNVCGASDDSLFGDSKNPSFHLMQNAIRGALGIEQFKFTYPEVDTPDKSPIRDYLNVVDLNEAHLLALDHLLAGGKSDIINLGTGTGNSTLEIVKQVEEITGKKVDATSGEKRRGDPARLVASIEKAKRVLNWQPKRSLADSVKSLTAWYRTHPDGWE